MADQLNNSGRNGAVYLGIGMEMEEAADHEIDIASGLDYNSQGDINIAVLGYLDGQISHLQAAYAIHSAHIYRWLNIYVVIQGAILTALFSSAQQMKPRPAWCSEVWWISPLNLSAIASAGVIYAVLCKFVEQFQLLKRRRDFQEERRNLIVDSVGITSKIRNRFLFLKYNRGSVVFDEAADEKYHMISRWAAKRVAFLGFFMAFSLCLLLSCTRLLCPLALS